MRYRTVGEVSCTMADEDWDIDDADVQVKGLSLDADDDDEVAELEAKVKADPNNADLLAQLAAAQHESGDDAGAIDNYTKAIGIDAKAGYYYNLGLAYKANDEAKEAQGAFEDAVKQDPKHAGATLALGNIALDAGNTEEALKHFATVRSIDASNVDAHAIPAQILQSKGSADELKVKFCGKENHVLVLNAYACTGSGWPPRDCCKVGWLE